MPELSRRALLAAITVTAGAAAAGSVEADARSAKSPEDAAVYHAGKLAEALTRVRPGRWVGTLSPDKGFAIFHRLG